MANRSTFPQVVLGLFLVSALILTGGGLFEHIVMTPLWAGSPPESVTQWQYGGIQGKFFKVASPIYYLFSLLLIVSSWRMPPRQRYWALAAGVTGILIAVATFGFFLPILRQTQVTRGAGLSGEEIVRLVHQFKSWNVARWVVLIGGVLAAMRAFTVSAQAWAASSSTSKSSVAPGGITPPAPWAP